MKCNALSSFSDQYSSHKSSIDTAIWNQGVTQQPVSNDGDAKTFSAAVMGPLGDWWNTNGQQGTFGLNAKMSMKLDHYIIL